MREVEEELEPVHHGGAPDEPKHHHKVKKLVEIDYDDKTLALNCRLDTLPYSIWVINQAAPRTHRKEFITYLRKNYPEFFDGKDIQKECESITKKTEELADLLEQKFIEASFLEENLPCFDFDPNLNEDN